MVKTDYCPKIGGDCPHKSSKSANNCFIMMEYDGFYSTEIEKMLKHAVKTVFHLNPILAKYLKHPESRDMYCTKVCHPIKEATLCIADVTYNNLNVGYEIGVAQKFSKYVIFTRYIPKGKNLSKEDNTHLKRIQQKGIVQISEVPIKIESSDIQGDFRVDYKDQAELKGKLKAGFEVKKKKSI